jgi:hypothetical protein
MPTSRDDGTIAKERRLLSEKTVTVRTKSNGYLLRNAGQCITAVRVAADREEERDGKNGGGKRRRERGRRGGWGKQTRKFDEDEMNRDNNQRAEEPKRTVSRVVGLGVGTVAPAGLS